MSSLRHAAALLAGIRQFRDLALIAAVLGFDSPAPLDREARAKLGLSGVVRRARVASGSGALRALLLDIAPGAPVHDAVSRAAAELALRAPQLLWMIVALEPATRTLVIAVPSPEKSARVSALRVDAGRVLDSDAETVAAIAAVRCADDAADLLVHHRWRELLGRDALTRRFYRELEQVVTRLAASTSGNASGAVRREIALLYASRLLFLAFLEAKGWLDGDRGFLRRAFDDRCGRGGEVHRRLLEPLFFGTLNTPVRARAPAARALGRIPFLNGGLFSRTSLEKRARTLRFPDDALGALIGGLLARYRVTAREDSSSWSEAAVDPEMLGRAFESLMASSDRRASGAFYTPALIIERVAGEGLEEVLAARGAPPDLARAAAAGDTLDDASRQQLRAALAGLRVLDPACGSGAFLVYVLERLADLAGAAGDTRAVGLRRRDVLTSSIFGVDVNPTATWLCELRLWLSVVIDADERDPLTVTPLPNLDRHIRVGDALAGAAFDGAAAVAPAVVVRLRGRYCRSTGARKRTLARALDREERRVALAVAENACRVANTLRQELLCVVRGRDLFSNRVRPTAAFTRELAVKRIEARAARRRIIALRQGAPLPFAFPVHFADAAAHGGFDLVIGNPPWVRLHDIPADARNDLRNRYRAFRDAAWRSGAADTGAGCGFAAQVDLASLFVERSCTLARPGGVISLLLPAKLWRSLAGGGVRRVLRDATTIRALEDWSDADPVFDAVVYPSLLVARRDERERDRSAPTDVRAAVYRRQGRRDWPLAPDRLPLDESPGAPWLLVPGEVRAAFERLAAAGPPMSRSPFGRPLLGVKCGCNEAFVVSAVAGWRDVVGGHCPVRAGDREASVERDSLRPLLRGESVRPWRSDSDGAAIVWTHDILDAPLAALPEGVARWLTPWRHRLRGRSDTRPGGRWWSLFRTEAARSDRPRVVWNDIGRAPRALVLPAGDDTVPLNSCYVARAPSMDDALTLAALLNSPLVAAWLWVIAEPARGAYRRFLGWTLARLPLPLDWPRAVTLLAPLAHRALAGAPPELETLADVAMRAYRIRPSDVSALVEWCAER